MFYRKIIKIVQRLPIPFTRFLLLLISYITMVTQHNQDISIGRLPLSKLQSFFGFWPVFLLTSFLCYRIHFRRDIAFRPINFLFFYFYFAVINVQLHTTILKLCWIIIEIKKSTHIISEFSLAETHLGNWPPRCPLCPLPVIPSLSRPTSILISTWLVLPSFVS